MSAGASGTPAIELDCLSKRYVGGPLALDGVSFSVQPGEAFGLLGPNGAGKSTAIRILLHMARPTGGRAAVMGFDAQDDPVAARRLLGYLPGNPKFYGKMTAVGLFQFVARARGLSRESGFEAYTAALVRRLGLDDGRPLRILSRGNQQKVGLVVALMARPPVVILDEPTSGLDPLVQEVTHDLVREVSAEGRTVFFSSHILPEVEEVCHRVAVLREGALRPRRAAPYRRPDDPVTFDAPPSADAFFGLHDVTVSAVEGARVTFRVRDGIDGLVKRLTGFTVLELESREPTLEDFSLAVRQRDRRRTMMVVFWQSMRQARASVVAYGVGLALYAALMTLLYLSMESTLSQMSEGYPQEFLEAFGVAGISLGDPRGFFSAEFFSMTLLILGAFAVFAATGALAGEEGAGTME